jgi:hypothetical protein
MATTARGSVTPIDQSVGVNQPDVSTHSQNDEQPPEIPRDTVRIEIYRELDSISPVGVKEAFESIRHDANGLGLRDLPYPDRDLSGAEFLYRFQGYSVDKLDGLRTRLLERHGCNFRVI